MQSTRRYLTALDGLRAIAVVAVFLYHADVAWMPGGFLGVDLFFVLSGYLITSLLQREYDTTGGIDLDAFWARRFRRLMPAQLLVIAAVATGFALWLPDEVFGLRGDVVATLMQVQNWHLIRETKSYFEQIGRPSPLQHFWSLAVEMHFYMLWPWLFAWLRPRMRPRVIALLALALAGGSSLWMAALHSLGAEPSRLYLGSDTHCAAVMLGAAVALFWAPFSSRLVPSGQRFLPLLGWPALLGLLAAFVWVGEYDVGLYQGGFLVAALVACALIASVSAGKGRLAAWLSSPPARWLGARSYSIYLWHFPVTVLTRPRQDILLDGLALLALRAVITLVLADLTYRLIEQPFRGRDIYRKLWEGRLRTATVHLAIGLLVGGLAVQLGHAVRPSAPAWLVDDSAPPLPTASNGWNAPGTPGTPIDDTFGDDAFACSDDGAEEAMCRPVLTTSDSPTQERAQPAAYEGAIAALPPMDAPYRPEAFRGKLPGRVLAVGDSVMLGARRFLRTPGTEWRVDAAVGRQASKLVKMLHHPALLWPTPQAAVVHIGNNGTLYPRQISAMLRRLRRVKHVVFLTVRVPRRWQPSNNAALVDTAKGSDGRLVVADWNTYAADRDDWFRSDGYHLTPEGAQAYAQFVFETLAEATKPIFAAVSR